MNALRHSARAVVEICAALQERAHEGKVDLCPAQLRALEAVHRDTLAVVEPTAR